MFKNKKLLLFIGLILIALIIFVVRFNSTRKTNGQITTAKVTQKDLTEEVSSSGKTKAKLEAVLKFQTSGKLAWVGVKEGDNVYAYQAIATLDAAELQKNLDKALRDYSKERNDFDEDKIVTYHDTFITNTVRRILEKNQWDLDKAVMDVELKDIALKNATLITPIAGIVTEIDTPVAGVNITTTSTFKVIDPTSIVFSANVDEVDVGKIILGQTAKVSLDAYSDKTFLGKVSKIAYAAETSSGGATVFPIEVTFTDSQNLRVGLNGDVAFELNHVTNVLSVPSDAIREEGDNKYVVKKTGSVFEKVTVKTGIAGDDDTEILSGLAVNDEVVTKGFQYLPKSLAK